MSATRYAVLLFVAAAASVLVLRSSAAALLSVFGSFCLLYAVYRNDRTAGTAGAWAVYLPLAYAVGAALPSIWNFVAAALFVMWASEMMSFEMAFSSVTESPTGIDSETESRARAVHSAHTRDLLAYFTLVVPVVAASAALSRVTLLASVLFTGVLLLFLALVVYARK